MLKLRSFKQSHLELLKAYRTAVVLIAGLEQLVNALAVQLLDVVFSENFGHLSLVDLSTAVLVKKFKHF